MSYSGAATMFGGLHILIGKLHVRKAARSVSASDSTIRQRARWKHVAFAALGLGV